MELNQFRKNVKVKLTDEYIIGLINRYLNFNVNFLSSSSDIKTLFSFDINSRGIVNQQEFIQFKNQLLRLFLEQKGFSNLPNSAKSNIMVSANSELIQKLNTSPFYIFSTKGLVTDSLDKLDHSFIINVPAPKFVNVLRNLYESLSEMELDDVRIMTPAISKVKSGYNDSIIVRCSSKDLEKTLNMLYGYEDSLKEIVGTLSCLVAKADSWLGYETYDISSNMTSSDKICKVLIEAIDSAILRYSKVNIGKLYGSTHMPFDRYKASFDNINMFRQTFVVNHKVFLVPLIIQEFKIKLKELNVDLSDLFNNSETKVICDEIYGKLEDEQEIVINTPVTITREDTLLNGETIENESTSENLGSLIESVEREVEDQVSKSSQKNNSTYTRSINTRDMIIPEFLKRAASSGNEAHIVEPVSVIDNASLDGAISEEESVSTKVTNSSAPLYDYTYTRNIDVHDMVIPDFLQQRASQGTEVQDVVNSVPETTDVVTEANLELGISDEFYEPNPDEVISVVDLAKKDANFDTPTVEDLTEAMESSEDFEITSSGDYLSEEEVAAVINGDVLINQQVENVGQTYELAMKYSGLVKDIKQLNNKVNGTNMTVLEYFETYGLLDKISTESEVVMHDGFGVRKSAVDFVSDDLINYLVQNGQGDLDYVINLYAESIESKQVVQRKKSLISSFLKK